MKMIFTGSLLVVVAVLAGVYSCFTTFFSVNAERRSANQKAAERGSANPENAAVAHKLKAQAGK